MSYLPWPVWGLILEYANDWKLRGVCRKFKIYTEKTFVFKWEDARALARYGTVEMVKKYISQYNFPRWDWLDTEIVRNSIDIIEFFMKRCTLWNLAYLFGLNNSVEKVKYFSDKFTHDQWNNCLLGACMAGHPELIKLAIANGADDYAAGRNRLLRGKHLELLYLLDTDKKITNHHASLMGFVNLLSEPILWGPCMLNACIGAHVEFVKTAIANGADDWAGALMNICAYEDNAIQREELFNIVLEKCVVHELSEPLNMACFIGNFNFVKALIKKGATITSYTVHSACSSGHYEIVDYLISCGAKNCGCIILEVERQCHLSNPNMKKIKPTY